MKGLLTSRIERVEAYSYWTPQLSQSAKSVGYVTQEAVSNSIIVAGGYLVRTAMLQGSELHISADFNASASLEIIGVPPKAKSLVINDKAVPHSVGTHGFWTVDIKYEVPRLEVPFLPNLTWKYADSLQNSRLPTMIADGLSRTTPQRTIPSPRC